MDKKYLVKNDNFTLAQYDFNLETQQILFAMLYKINSKYIKPFELKNSKGEITQLEYNLNFEELKKLVGIDYDLENHKEKVKRIITDLSKKTVIFDTKEFFAVDGLIIQPVIDNINKTMTFNISTRVKPLLNEVFKKFTKFGFKHLSLCQSKYTFRLYEILITKSKNISEEVKEIKISVEELRKILQIPKSINYSQFKERVLEVAKNEFNALFTENKQEQKEKRLFKNFNYTEIVSKKRGRGRNPITDITFTFEFLEETKILMKTRAEIEKEEMEKEDWILTEIKKLINKNKDREPYFKTINPDMTFGIITSIIEDIKKQYNVYGNLKQILIKKTLESAFNKFDSSFKYIDFKMFLKNGFEQNAMHFIMTNKGLQED